MNEPDLHDLLATAELNRLGCEVRKVTAEQARFTQQSYSFINSLEQLSLSTCYLIPVTRSFTTTTMEALSFHDVVAVLQSARVTNYGTVAGIVLYGYDYLLTLDFELSLIWGSRWGLVKVLFLLVRYMPFVDTVLLIFYLTRDGTSPTACRVTFQICAWLFVVGVSAAEILLTIRTWACWDRARGLTIGLLIFFLAIWIPIYVFLGLYARSLVVIRPPYYAIQFGCFYPGAKPVTVACWAGMMIYDAGLLLLMGIRGFPTLKDMQKETLSKVVYRDGLIYYLLLFVLSLVNVLVIRYLPYKTPNLFTTVERVMYSILACRAILHIREQNSTQDRNRSLNLSALNSQPVVFT